LAGTVTEAGTVAAGLPLVRAMLTPPTPAGPLSVTVPSELVPPTTELGTSEIPDKVPGLTVRIAVLLTLPRVAVIVGEDMAFTPTVVIVNVAEVCPAATVTVAGTEAGELLELRLTTIPPVPA